MQYKIKELITNLENTDLKDNNIYIENWISVAKSYDNETKLKVLLLMLNKGVGIKSHLLYLELVRVYEEYGMLDVCMYVLNRAKRKKVSDETIILVELDRINRLVVSTGFVFRKEEEIYRILHPKKLFLWGKEWIEKKIVVDYDYERFYCPDTKRLLSLCEVMAIEYKKSKKNACGKENIDTYERNNMAVNCIQPNFNNKDESNLFIEYIKSKTKSIDSDFNPTDNSNSAESNDLYYNIISEDNISTNKGMYSNMQFFENKNFVRKYDINSNIKCNDKIYNIEDINLSTKPTDNITPVIKNDLYSNIKYNDNNKSNNDIDFKNLPSDNITPVIKKDLYSNIKYKDNNKSNNKDIDFKNMPTDNITPVIKKDLYSNIKYKDNNKSNKDIDFKNMPTDNITPAIKNYLYSNIKYKDNNKSNKDIDLKNMPTDNITPVIKKDLYYNIKYNDNNKSNNDIDFKNLSTDNINLVIKKNNDSNLKCNDNNKSDKNICKNIIHTENTNSVINKDIDFSAKNVNNMNCTKNKTGKFSEKMIENTDIISNTNILKKQNNCIQLIEDKIPILKPIDKKSKPSKAINVVSTYNDNSLEPKNISDKDISSTNGILKQPENVSYLKRRETLLFDFDSNITDELLELNEESIAKKIISNKSLNQSDLYNFDDQNNNLNLVYAKDKNIIRETGNNSFSENVKLKNSNEKKINLQNYNQPKKDFTEKKNLFRNKNYKGNKNMTENLQSIIQKTNNNDINERKNHTENIFDKKVQIDINQNLKYNSTTNFIDVMFEKNKELINSNTNKNFNNVKEKYAINEIENMFNESLYEGEKINESGINILTKNNQVYKKPDDSRQFDIKENIESNVETLNKEISVVDSQSKDIENLNMGHKIDNEKIINQGNDDNYNRKKYFDYDTNTKNYYMKSKNNTEVKNLTDESTSSLSIIEKNDKESIDNNLNNDNHFIKGSKNVKETKIVPKKHKSFKITSEIFNTTHNFTSNSSKKNIPKTDSTEITKNKHGEINSSSKYKLTFDDKIDVDIAEKINFENLNQKFFFNNSKKGLVDSNKSTVNQTNLEFIDTCILKNNIASVKTPNNLLLNEKNLGLDKGNIQCIKEISKYTPRDNLKEKTGNNAKIIFDDISRVENNIDSNTNKENVENKINDYTYLESSFFSNRAQGYKKLSNKNNVYKDNFDCKEKILENLNQEHKDKNIETKRYKDNREKHSENKNEKIIKYHNSTKEDEENIECKEIILNCGECINIGKWIYYIKEKITEDIILIKRIGTSEKDGITLKTVDHCIQKINKQSTIIKKLLSYYPKRIYTIKTSIKNNLYIIFENKQFVSMQTILLMFIQEQERIDEKLLIYYYNKIYKIILAFKKENLFIDLLCEESFVIDSKNEVFLVNYNVIERDGNSIDKSMYHILVRLCSYTNLDMFHYVESYKNLDDELVIRIEKDLESLCMEKIFMVQRMIMLEKN